MKEGTKGYMLYIYRKDYMIEGRKERKEKKGKGGREEGKKGKKGRRKEGAPA